MSEKNSKVLQEGNELLNNLNIGNISSLDYEQIEQVENTLNDFITKSHLEQEMNYYGILNISNTATDDDIKQAYKKYSLIFHPDRHQSTSETKEIAQQKFQLIHKAYEVLIDPNRRYLYDKHGAEAADTTWDVAVSDGTMKTPQQVLAEYEKLKREQDAMNRLVGNLQSETQSILQVDASPIFYKRKQISTGYPGMNVKNVKNRGFADLIKITGGSITQSWTQTLASGTQLVYGGTVYVRNGLGMTNFNASIRKLIMDTLTLDVSGSVGPNSRLSIKFDKAIGQKTFASFVTSWDSFYEPAYHTLIMGRSFTPTSVGYIRMSTPAYMFGNLEGDYRIRSCTLGASTTHKKKKFSGEIETGIYRSSITFSMNTPITESIKGKVSMAVSTDSGLSSTFTAARKITDLIKLALATEFNTAVGINFYMKFSRLGQKLTIPIFISPEFNVGIMAAVLTMPFIGIAMLEQLYLEPKRRQEIARKLKEMRESNHDLLQQRKKEAEDAIFLMRDSVSKKQYLEDEKDGLVIVNALYGKSLPVSPLSPIRKLSSKGIKTLAENLNDRVTQSLGSFVDLEESKNRPQEEEKEYIDVTIAVQALVNNSQLFISGGYSKSKIIGFYDPCLGEEKMLRITYRFQGRLHQLEASDMSPVAAPLKDHIVSNANND